VEPSNAGRTDTLSADKLSFLALFAGMGGLGMHDGRMGRPHPEAVLILGGVLAMSAPALALPEGISQVGPDTYKVATSEPVTFPRTLGKITDTEKAAVQVAKAFCGEQGHQVFVVLFATPTDSKVTFRCGDLVPSVP
jgi:hypothetical protein